MMRRVMTRPPRSTADFDQRFSRELISAIEQRLGSTDGKVDDHVMVDATVRTMARAADDIVADIVVAAPRALRRERSSRRGFERRLADTWTSSFDALSDLCAVFAEYGEEYYRTGVADDSIRESALFAALLQLHGRSCRVAREIETLLRAGLPDGAFARWRTLHEIAVTALLIAQEGETLAQRYLEHDTVKRYTLMLAHDTHAKALGHQPPTSEERAALHTAYKSLLASHGDAFAEDYGWAALVIKGRPTFARLERHAKLDRFRPYYSWSSSGVHAGPHGLTGFAGRFRMGEPMPAGSTNTGLADPGQNTAISLSQIFAALAVVRGSPFFTLSSIVVGKLAKRCQDAFIADSCALDERIRAMKDQTAPAGRKPKS